MYSLSYFCKYKNIEFDYYIKSIPSFLKDNPHGNYKYALMNDINFIEDDIDNIEILENQLFIKEGISELGASEGILLLANEIVEYKSKNNIINLNIFLPSGTGTTSIYLQKYLKSYDIKVYTTNCVGDEKYLKKQFLELESDENNFPIVLTTKKKYHFGKLYKEFYEIYKELYTQTSIEFDLLYDSKAWITILEYEELFKENLLYIHQGGIIGNESMIMRYKRKFG